MARYCQICGGYSGKYPLCYKHLEMKGTGEIIKCENCGTWHLKDEKCSCKIEEVITYTDL